MVLISCSDTLNFKEWFQVDGHTSSVVHTNPHVPVCVAPLYPCKAQIATTFDKLYYLDLALPNDDDAELVSPPASNTFGVD